MKREYNHSSGINQRGFSTSKFVLPQIINPGMILSKPFPWWGYNPEEDLERLELSRIPEVPRKWENLICFHPNNKHEKYKMRSGSAVRECMWDNDKAAWRFWPLDHNYCHSTAWPSWWCRYGILTECQEMCCFHDLIQYIVCKLIILVLHTLWTSLVAHIVKHLPTTQETRVQSLGWEDLLETEMATHSSILAWKIAWKEEPVRLQSMGSQRVRHDWATSLFVQTYLTWIPMNVELCDCLESLTHREKCYSWSK